MRRGRLLIFEIFRGGGRLLEGGGAYFKTPIFLHEHLLFKIASLRFCIHGLTIKKPLGSLFL